MYSAYKLNKQGDNIQPWRTPFLIWILYVQLWERKVTASKANWSVTVNQHKCAAFSGWIHTDQTIQVAGRNVGLYLSFWNHPHKGNQRWYRKQSFRNWIAGGKRHCLRAPEGNTGRGHGFTGGWLDSVQLLSCVQLFATPWTAAHQASLSITNTQSLLKLTSIESVMPSNHLILCRPLLLLPSIFPTIRVFLVSQFFTSGGHSIGVSASASVLPINIQDWFPLRWTGWISLQSKGLSRVFPSTTVWKHQFSAAQPSLWSNSLNSQ